MMNVWSLAIKVVPSAKCFAKRTNKNYKSLGLLKTSKPTVNVYVDFSLALRVGQIDVVLVSAVVVASLQNLRRRDIDCRLERVVGVVRRSFV